MTEEQKRQQQAQLQSQPQNTAAPAPQSSSAQQTQQTAEAPKLQQAQSAPQSSPAQQAADASYNQAMGALQKAANNSYAAGLDAEIQSIYSQIMGRDSFSYNLSEDALYDMYRQNYTDMGKLAMRDTIGQAAALTGGYGSSYGQAVGQQAYDSYLQSLNDIVPELYGQAYQRYADEGDRLSQMYNLALGEKDRFYAEQDYNYARLMELLNATGYEPTAEEAAAAGLTEDQVQQLLKAWRIQNPGLYNQMTGNGRVYYGGGRGSEDDDDTDDPKDKINLELEDDKLGVEGTYDNLYQQEYDRIMKDAVGKVSPTSGPQAVAAAQNAAAQYAINTMVKRGYTAEQITSLFRR